MGPRIKSNKIDFQSKRIKRDREEDFILIKGKTHQEDILILNIYAPNSSSPILIKERVVKLKLNIVPYILIVHDLNPLSPMARL